MLAQIQEATGTEAPVEADVPEPIKARPGHVVKTVLKPKKTIMANDGGGDWEVVTKREKYMIQKPEDSDSDEPDSD